MAFQDFLLRANRPASLAAFNAVLPSKFKLGGGPAAGVNLILYTSLMLKDGDPPILSSDVHYNLRVTNLWSGFSGLFITDPADPDFNDPTINRLKLKRWMRNEGVVKLDTADEHPRSGRTMRWFRWEDPNGIDWLDITMDAPEFQRHTWLTSP